MATGNGTALAVAEPRGLAEQHTIAYTPQQVDLIKKTIFPNATDNELALFLGQCQRTGLDAFAKQIYAIKRGGKLTIQVGIDGFRLIAQRTGHADGQDGPYWCGEDGVWREVWTDRERPPHAAKIVVYRKGSSRGYTGVAHLTEFYSKDSGMWDKMPAVMLAKTAEAVALRKAFPAELSGLCTDDEMAQAGEPVTVHPAPTGPSPEQVAVAAAGLSAAATLDQLAATWKATPRELQALLTPVKDARKAALTPAGVPVTQTPPPKAPARITGQDAAQLIHDLDLAGFDWPAARLQFGPAAGIASDAAITDLTPKQRDALVAALNAGDGEID